MVLSVGHFSGQFFAPKPAEAAPTTIFSDSFESGNFSSWTSDDDHWHVSSGSGHTGSKKAYVCDQDSSDDILIKNIATTGYETITFSYYYRAHQALENTDHVYVEWWNGSVWTQLVDHTNLSVGSWTQASFSLPAGANNNANLKIMFRASGLAKCSGGKGDKDEFQLDSVSLTGQPSPFCGDNIVNGNEQCDGNLPQDCTTNDGYSGTQSCIAPHSPNMCTWDNCITTEYCGDGIKNGPEICDGEDGNFGQHEYCTQTCEIAVEAYCGDGIKNGNEECDGTNGVNEGYRCTQNCTLEQIPNVCQVGPISLLNGDFETPEVTHNSKWDIFASGANGVGWTVEWEGVYDGAPQTANLELHRGVNSWSPYSGSQYTELDSDWDGPDGSVNGEQASVKIYQDVTTIPGAAYVLSYAYSPRPGKGTADNYLGVRLDNALVKEHQTDGTALSDTSWQTDSVNFVATSTSVRIEFVDLGTPNSFGPFLDQVTLQLTECPYPKATVLAHKIVCDNEEDLPNWSGNNITINVNTAQNFVNASEGKCHFAEGWQFQWGSKQLKLPGDTIGITNDSNWHMFDTATGQNGQPAQVNINLTGLPGKLWFREVLQEGYIPFSFPSTEYPTAPGSNISAEFWCNTDVLNYDNSEFINVSEGNTYYCVAMNVPEPKPVDPTGTIEVCKYEDTNGDGLIDGYSDDQSTPINPLLDWTINITGPNNYSDTKTTGDDGCVQFTNLPYASYTITETQQSGWVQTYPGNNSILIDLDANYNWTYFLNHQTTSDDGDGEQETGDGGGQRISGGGGPVPTYNPAISIAKTGDASVIPGGVGNFNLTVTNTGNAVATNVVVTDTLPAGFTFTDNSSDTHSWDLGNMNAGQVEVINYSVNVPTDANGQYTNISVVSINGSTVAPYYAEDDYQFTAVQVLGFETEAPAEEPEVQVLGYEALPETGGPVSSDFTLYGLFMVLAGGYLVSRYSMDKNYKL